MAGLLTSDSQRCKQLALWAWVAAGGGFLVLMYASFGWVGPAPAFLTWSAFTVPLFLLTWRWRHSVGADLSPRGGRMTLLVWVLLGAAIPLVETPTNEAPSPAQWILMIALVLFPIGLTWRIIRVIDEHQTRSPGAA